MTTSQALISAHNISLSHHGKSVLDNVSFELKAGEFITLIGPNGAGKSSLIKVLLGLIKADSGDIKRSGDIRLGYTPQTFSPNPFIPISVIGFLNLNQKVAKNFLHETALLTGIEGLLDSPLKSLSGGELQRVLLARALLNKPNVLILDEPAQNLDYSRYPPTTRLCGTDGLTRPTPGDERINASVVFVPPYLLHGAT